MHCATNERQSGENPTSRFTNHRAPCGPIEVAGRLLLDIVHRLKRKSAPRDRSGDEAEAGRVVRSAAVDLSGDAVRERIRT
jgi:hypothetical protein